MLRSFRTAVATAREAALRRQPAAARPQSARNHWLTLERLEPRLVLDGNSLVISEFMADNESILPDENNDFEDWIEIHNPTSETVRLEGWYLSDKNDNPTKWQFPDVSIEAGDYLVVFASEKNRRDPSGELHTNFKLNDQGEYLGLIRPDGETVQFAYDPGYPPQFNDVSYGLSPDLSRLGYFTQPTPWFANWGDPVDDPIHRVIINEIMYHPSSEDVLEEYIELFNLGREPVSLAGWRFSDGVQVTIPELPEVTIDPDQYLVVAADLATFTAKYPQVTPVVGGWEGRLRDSGETIELVDATGERVDRVRYADEGDWGIREEGPNDLGHTGWIWTAEHDGGGKSLELINPLLPNEYGQNWAASDADEGTPGAANSVAAADVPPMILDVAHFPIIPRSTDAVTVTARLKDELATGLLVELNARVDGTPSFFQYSMLDDGFHGDGEPADGVYGAVVPPFPDGSIIEFFVSATDGNGNGRTWPAPTQPADELLANLLYQVDDTFDPRAPWDPEGQPVYRLIMTEAERAELADIGAGGGDQNSDAQMNGTFICIDGTGGEVRYNVGIRNRGNGTRRNPPNNYRVNFVHDRPWYDVTRVNVNARYPYVQLFGSAAFRLAGLAAADTSVVRARVNGADLAEPGVVMYGSYVHLEVIDGDFVDAHFPDDNQGNLYKVFGAGELDYRGTNPDSYRNNYFKQTNEDLDDWSDIIRLTDVLNNEPEETYLQQLGEVVNIDQWLRYLALDALLGNLEGGLTTGRGDDFAMYRGVEDPRFVLIPHDLDTLMGQGNTASNPNRDIFVYEGVTGLYRLLNHPEITPRYYAAFLDLIDTFYNPETLSPLLDQLLGGFVPQMQIDEMKQYVLDRTAGVLAQIPQELSVTSDLPVVDGYPQTDIPVALLDGTADGVATRSVLVDGLAADWDPRTGQWHIGEERGEEHVIVAQGSQWSYLQDGSDQGTAWREPGFTPDPPWDTGNGVLAHETGALPAAINTQLTLGVRTYYFRKHFDFDGDPEDVNLRLTTLIDDGAIFYLNGTELRRLGMPGGDVDFQTFASRGIGNATFEGPFPIPSDALVPGDNVIAVEVHQRSDASSDIVFDLELTANYPIQPVGVPLHPGLNRVVVESFDGPDGTGNLLEEGFIDVWYDPDSGGQVIPGGTITEDVVLVPETGPYRVAGDVIVDTGATMTIGPGTTVMFEADTSLTIRGRLVAEGTRYGQIRLTRVPGGGNWNGVQLLGTMEDNRLSYAVLEYGVTDNGLVGLENANLRVDHVTFDHTPRRRIRAEDSSLIVRHSTFTDTVATGQEPTDDLSEHIWGRHVAHDGQLIIENNVFGNTPGHNAGIDFDAGFRSYGDPVPQILDNVFLGGGDAALDLEGDAHVEGNVFRHFHKDPYNTDPGQSAVIRAAGSVHELVVVRNVFYDVDHAVLVGDGSFVTFVNNTVVGVDLAAVDFDLEGQTGGPGLGAFVDGCIFAEVPVAFDAVLPGTDLTVNRSVFPPELEDPGLGTGNLFEDPRLADPEGGRFGLRPGSPALGTGPGGRDMGAMVPGGVSVCGEPPALTARTEATLLIGPPGAADPHWPVFSHYKYRVNDGPWSGETPIEAPVQLTGLVDGDYTVFAVGTNSAGAWQDEAHATASKTWTVDTSPARIRINEVLAINAAAVDHQGTFPDLIELVNEGTSSVDLAGMSISDDAGNPTRFVFPGDLPAETTIGPGGYLVLYADAETGTSGLHLGFALDGDGDGVLLYDTVENGRALLDSVEFGPQVPDMSIGRAGHQRDWALTQPTLGAANVARRTGDPARLKINEWFTNGEVRFDDDFVELFNADALPVALGGLFLTDHPAAQPDKHEIAPLSFIAAGGFAVFWADGHPEAGAGHVDFQLSAEQELLGLFDAGLGQIQQIIYYQQTTDFSQGRFPDGADRYVFSRLPTPGVANVGMTTSIVEVLAWDAPWAYDDTGNGQGTDWRGPDFSPDPAWPTGPGPLGWEDTTLPLGLNTQVATGASTYYFRTPFTLDADPANVQLEMTTLIDDGAIYYLNGVEAMRLGMPGGQVDYNTPSARSVTNADFEGPFSLPTGALTRGENLLAVEVHQNTSGNADIVLGVALDTVVTVPVDPSLGRNFELLDGLRITELMYNPDGNADAEFVELQNVGHALLDLAGVRLAGGIDFTFPPLMLAPGQYVVVVRDPEAFEADYGAGINVAGQYSGNLSNGGEEIVLKLGAPFEAAVLRFAYGDSWYPSTDGGGFALEIRDPAAPPARWGEAASWRAGTIEAGTPGSADGNPLRNVLINEVLTHTDDPLVDAIELYNPTGSQINLGGWYLSDSDATFVKFRIPDGTLIAAGGYVVFDESDFNPTPQQPGPEDFALNGAHGDDVWLLEADAEGRPVRVVDHVAFGAAGNGESFGRWPSGSGALYPMIRPTLDKERPENGNNSGPRVGPVIISEVHYHPDLADAENLEFLEIFNSSAQTVDLTGWRLGKGIDFDFPAGTELGPRAVLVVVPFEPSDADVLEAFRAAYGIDESVELVGGYRGRLSDDGEKVQLQRPDQPPPDEEDFIPRLLEDEVAYANRQPWPTDPDGGGTSLNRLDADVWGNDSFSWASVAPTPGVVEIVARVTGRYLFYNNSVYDGRNPAANAQDDHAIAPDKVPLMPGGTAGFANYTSHSGGINGIMVDVDGLPYGAILEADDFRFRVGNSNDPSTWAAAPALPTISMRPGEGRNGSARITLIWNNNLIHKQWLQVTVLATGDTGLAEEDVFYFGNAIGETGNSTSDAKVNAFDMLGSRDNQRTFINPAPIDFAYDFNHDARVNTYDMLIARDNQTHFLNALKLISVPGPEKASLKEIVLERVAGQTAGQREISSSKFAWLGELEQTTRPRRTAGENGSDEDRVDAVLAYWA